jgi:hypothetical protein
VKYIKKNIEPQSFNVWKKLENEDWQPSWDNFGKPEKTEVHNSSLFWFNWVYTCDFI